MTYRLRAAINRPLMPASPDCSNDWHHRRVNWPATVVFPRKGYRLMQERPAQILRVSEGDVILKVAAPRDIGESFYIQLDVEDRPLIPCWSIGKTSSAIYAHFHGQLTCEALDIFEETFVTRAALEALLEGTGA